MENKLSGTSLSGMSTTRDRVCDDYYATSSTSIISLLDNIKFGGKFLEPCVGGGHIAELIKKYYPNNSIKLYDIVDRGYDKTIVSDYLTNDFGHDKFDSIVTNPPYSLAKEFLEKSMSILNKNGKIAMFLKIQFLEGLSRKVMFEKYPPKYIYVFTKRQNPLRNGEEKDENGKAWSSTMCFAWFVWEEGSTTEPIIRWI